MRPLGDIARRTGRTAALSVFALIFFLSAVTLLTLAAFFLLVPFYGPGQTLLILGIVHLAISLIFAGLMMLGRHRRPRDRQLPQRLRLLKGVSPPALRPHFSRVSARAWQRAASAGPTTKAFGVRFTAPGRASRPQRTSSDGLPFHVILSGSVAQDAGRP